MLSKDEIRGDWSNLKGTEYHLVYALWLLLRDEAVEIAFYEGNDLRAEPVCPPTIKTDTASDGPIPLKMQRGTKDVWIQLKATAKPWTVANLLEDNLLENFICNALSSLNNGRAWEARLVTTAEMKRDKVLGFVNNPRKEPKRLTRILEIISIVNKRRANDPDPPSANVSPTLDLALEILRSISNSEPVPLAVLKAEIEAELCYGTPNRQAVANLATQLLGAMLSDAAGGPARKKSYDVKWLQLVGGSGIKSDKPFDKDASLGCDAAVARALPANWNADHFAARPRLHALFDQFLGSTVPLFILLGAAGTGKTWAVARWATHELAHKIRVFQNASTLNPVKTLDGIIGSALSPFVGSMLKEEEYLARFCAAATGRGSIRPVVILDDLQPPRAAADWLPKQLARLTRRASETGVKLVVTCQTDIWRIYRLWRDIPPQDIFAFEPQPIIGRAASPAVKQIQWHSLVLEDFSPDEQNDALARRLPPSRGNQAGLQLRAPGLTPLRRPYLLGLYIEQHGHDLGTAATAPDVVVVDDLLRQRVRDQVEHAAAGLGIEPDAVNRGVASLVTALWSCRPDALRHREAVEILSSQLPEEGKPGLEALHRVGLVTIEGGVRLAEEAVANHLIAAYLTERSERGDDITSLLVPHRDNEVLAALIRQSPNPTSFGDRLVRMDNCWSHPVAVGLSQCSADDLRAISMLIGLSRPEVEGDVNFEECRSLGLLSARGRRAWAQVLKMYLSDRPKDRRIGETALGAALEVVPELVGDAIRTRLSAEKERSAVISDKQLHRITDAFGPLHQIGHKVAASVGNTLLDEARRFLPVQWGAEAERLMDAINDIRGRAALFGEPGAVTALCDELASADPEIRFNAASALRPIAFEAPERVRPALLKALRKETERKVLSRLIWLSAKPIEISADDFLTAFRSSKISIWADPILVGPALAILGTAALSRPEDVQQMLPQQLHECEISVRALVSELLVYAWWCVAEKRNDARAQLKSLAEPELESLPPAFRPFALRGAALGRLAELCLDGHSAKTLGVRIAHFRGALIPEYLFVEAYNLLDAAAAELVSTPGYARVEEALLQCILAGHDKAALTEHEDLREAQYFCSVNSLNRFSRFSCA